MQSSFFAGILLLGLLSGTALAQDAAKQTPAQAQGKSLAAPDQQRQADEAMHTKSGKAGKDEPGAHAPLDGDQPVQKGDKLNVPNAPSQSSSPRH
jgi:hypothetical protein